MKFTFGMKVLRVTQNYNEGNHLPHWKGSTNYADYPIDVAGQDGGKDTYYATVDMQVTAKRGTAQGYTNTIWLVATEECDTPSGRLRPFIMLTHWNDDDPYTRNLDRGSIVKAGEPICKEGTAGQATGNHIHLVCGNANRGVGDNLIKNSNGKWVSNGYCMKPEQIMYINKDFTQVADTDGIDFQYTDQPTPPTPSPYPFEGVVEKGSPLYREDGSKYPNGASTDRAVIVKGEVNGRYQVYGETFNPHIVYVDKGNVVRKSSDYPFKATIKKGSQLYDANGNKYNKTNADRTVTVECEVNGRYQIYGQTFNPHIVYCDKGAIIR